MSLFSVLFATSASVIALFFAVLGIARSLQEKEKYFPLFVLQYCRRSLLLLYAVCLTSLFFLLFEEATLIGFRPIVIEVQCTINLAFICYVILSVVFALGLILMGLAAKELLKRSFPEEPSK